ncbi:RNA-directed DNA polymerase, eukaryota, partial [Tanacetum coccineum]
MGDGVWQEVSYKNWRLMFDCLAQGPFAKGHQRSKEDEVMKLYSSIFITNFVKNFSDKELWTGDNKPIIEVHKERGENGSKSYAYVVRNDSIPVNMKKDVPAIVIDESCINQLEYPIDLMGKVKEFTSMTNLKAALANEELHWSILKEYHLKGGPKIRSPVFLLNGGNYYTLMIRKKAISILREFAKEVSGWIHEFEDDDEDIHSDGEMSKDGTIDENGGTFKFPNVEDESDCEEVAETIFENNHSSANVKEDFVGVQKDTSSEYPFSIYKILNKKKDIKYSDSKNDTVGQAMGYNMEGCSKNIGDIIDFQGVNNGEWLPNGKKLLIISVYAPQELCEKKMLWDYLTLVINNWNDKVVIMGDFNEVRTQEERYGSIFNSQGAGTFNLFISSAGLEEVPLDGCKFTWCHKSATEMSKLDRLVISKNLMISCPNISAITLDCYLSDHRPILMRESHFDYGPVPFRFFHYLFDLEGFDNFVEQTWKNAQVADMNAMSKFMKKLKLLKERIRIWIKADKDRSKKNKQDLKADLNKI